jgi:preprotein translocase subunit Sss1
MDMAKDESRVICRRVRPTDEEIEEAIRETDGMSDRQMIKSIKKGLKKAFPAVFIKEVNRVLAGCTKPTLAD